MNDEHNGQGGSYVIDDNGARVLIERTRENNRQLDMPWPAPAAPDPTTEPANAGIFSPVAPADQSTAE